MKLHKKFGIKFRGKRPKEKQDKDDNNR